MRDDPEPQKWVLKSRKKEVLEKGRAPGEA